MSVSRDRPDDPAARAVRKRQLLERFEQAESHWGAAMRAHRLAPPDPGFAGRLAALSQAAETEADVCADAHELGLAWRPMPGAERAEPPYELRPGTGRRGPAQLWERFDVAVAHFNHATARTDSAAVAAAYREISASARALADAVESEDRDTAEATKRHAGAA